MPSVVSCDMLVNADGLINTGEAIFFSVDEDRPMPPLIIFQRV
jgi:hypothetical protein